LIVSPEISIMYCQLRTWRSAFGVYVLNSILQSTSVILCLPLTLILTSDFIATLLYDHELCKQQSSALPIGSTRLCYLDNQVFLDVQRIQKSALPYYLFPCIDEATRQFGKQSSGVRCYLLSSFPQRSNVVIPGILYFLEIL
jgi:hypothetical protein